MTQSPTITVRPGRAGTRHETEKTMTERVQGPAFYFPSIEKKYGRPISDWLDLIRGSELTRHKVLVDWLKASYGIGHGHATALVGYALAHPDANDYGPQSQHPAHKPASHPPAQ